MSSYNGFNTEAQHSFAWAPLLLIFCMTLMWQYGNAMLQLLQTVSGTPNREEYNSL